MLLVVVCKHHLGILAILDLGIQQDEEVVELLEHAVLKSK